MTTKTRDMLRSSVLETLLKTFPGSQIVKGGMAFVSDQIDEDTGVPLAVVLSITVPLTADTARSKAFDFDAAVADAKNAPGRRVADPVKKAEKEAKAAESKARERKNLAALTEWIEKGGLGEGMTPGTVHSHAAEIGLDVATPMMTGSLLKKLAEAGVVVKGRDAENKHNWFTRAEARAGRRIRDAVRRPSAARPAQP